METVLFSSALMVELVDTKDLKYSTELKLKTTIEPDRPRVIVNL